MKHDDVKHYLTLPIEDIDATVRLEMENHVASCPSCRSEASALQRLHELLHTSGVTPSEADLSEARAVLFHTLRRQSASPSWTVRLRDVLGLAECRALRPIAIGLVLAVAAFVGGSFAGRSLDVAPAGFQLAAYDPYQKSEESTLQIMNLRVLRQDEASGEIEFEFEAVMPAHIRGNMHEPRIQAILAHALVSSQNPGTRLRAANVIGSQKDDGTLDRRSRNLVKESLISALLYDKNRGVRMEALKALQPFLPDSGVTSAILEVLKREENVAMRIAAINSLDITKFDSQPARKRLMDALRDRSVSDANNYIRIRAAAALEEEQP